MPIVVAGTEPGKTPEIQHYENRWNLWRDSLLATLKGGAGWAAAVEAADKITETYRLRCEKQLGMDLAKSETCCASEALVRDE